MTALTICRRCDDPAPCKCASPQLVEVVRLCNRCNREMEFVCAHCRCPEFRLVEVVPTMKQLQLF